MSDLPRRARLYLFAITMAAVAVTVFLLQLDGPPSLGAALIGAGLIVALIIAHEYPLPFANHTQITLDSAVIMAGCILLPPGFAALVAMAGPMLAVRGQSFRDGETVFNAAHSVLQAAAIVAVFWMAGLYGLERPELSPYFLPIALLAGVAAFMVNTLAVALMIAAQERQSAWFVWRQAAVHLSRTEQAAQVAQVGIAILASALIHYDPWTVIFLVLPAAAVHSALSVNVRMRLSAESELLRQAYHDPLTDLPNRAYFMERLDEALTRAGDEEGTIALLFLDLDRFKLINDTLGHHAGDKLLVEIARRLRASVRDGDVISRLGGDEFTVLMEGVGDRALPERIAERIAEVLRDPISIDGRDIRPTTSVGVLLRERRHRKPTDLLRDADVALYAAKDTGRARYVVYAADQGEAVEARVSLGEQLAGAIASGEVDVVYDPIVRLTDGRILGFEARLSWWHPRLGQIGEAQIHEVAEDTGQTLLLVRHAATAALQDAAGWGFSGQEFTLHFDLWPELLADDQARSALVELIQTALIDPALVTLEIPETAIEGARALEVINQFGALGVKMLIDRVGLGASYLRRLDMLPAEAIKLDRAIASALPADRGPAAVARAMASLCADLELLGHAEGIRTLEQARWLQTLGYQRGQGPFWGPPRSSLDTTLLIQRAKEPTSQARMLSV